MNKEQIIEWTESADVVPRSEVERLQAQNETLEILVKDLRFRNKEFQKANKGLAKTIENLEIENDILREAKQEVAKEIFEQAFDYPTLADWYISSVNDKDTPVWTDEHIEELLNDFYVIPKEIADGYKM